MKCQNEDCPAHNTGMGAALCTYTVGSLKVIAPVWGCSSCDCQGAIDSHGFVAWSIAWLRQQEESNE